MSHLTRWLYHETLMDRLGPLPPLSSHVTNVFEITLTDYDVIPNKLTSLPGFVTLKYITEPKINLFNSLQS